MRDAWLGLSFLCAAAATLAAHATDPREVSGSPHLVAIPDLERWEVRTTGGGAVRSTALGVVLDTTGCTEPCRAAIVLHTTPLEGAGRATVAITRAGPLDRARLFAVERRSDRSASWMTGRNLADGVGSASVDVPASLAGRPIELGVVAIGTEGTITVDSLTVHPTHLSPAWIPWAGLAAFTWTGLGAVSTMRIVRAVPGPRRWLMVGVALPLLVGVLLPRPLDLPFVLQKVLGHGGAFALLGAISGSTGARWTTVLVRLAGFAAATELLQLFQVDRSASVADVAIDLLGACVGLLAVSAFRGRSSNSQS